MRRRRGGGPGGAHSRGNDATAARNRCPGRPRGRSRRRGRGWAGRARARRRQWPRAVAARRRPRSRSARRSGCRSSSRAPGQGPRAPHPAPERRGDGAAACRATGHRGGGCPARPAPASGDPLRRRTRTIGRTAEVRSPASASERWARSAAPSRSRTMTANGFSKRCLRLRSRSTAASDRASQARWYPPSPLTATISPRPSAVCAAARAASEPCTDPPSPACSNHSRGPHSAQATGWAWKRRSAGSWYSEAHASHMAKVRMVVFGRS